MRGRVPRVPRAAAEAVVWDRPELLALRRRARSSPFDAPDVELHAGGSRFDWRGVEVALAVPGVHNALNAAAALDGLPAGRRRPGRAAAALADFRGAGRRFERLGATRPARWSYDDYAHHPTEVAATLDAARTLAPAARGRGLPAAPVLAHRALAREFGAALAPPTWSSCSTIYPARERAEDFPGVSGRPGRRGGRRRRPAAGRSPGCRASTTPSATCATSCARATSCWSSAPATSTRSGARWSA